MMAAISAWKAVVDSRCEFTWVSAAETAGVEAAFATTSSAAVCAPAPVGGGCDQKQGARHEDNAGHERSPNSPR